MSSIPVPSSSSPPAVAAAAVVVAAGAAERDRTADLGAFCAAKRGDFPLGWRPFGPNRRLYDSVQLFLHLDRAVLAERMTRTENRAGIAVADSAAVAVAAVLGRSDCDEVWACWDF